MWVELSVGGVADLAKRNPGAYTVLLDEVDPFLNFLFIEPFPKPLERAKNDKMR
jgi:hypothetical protein